MADRRPYDIANDLVSSTSDPRGIHESDPLIKEYLKNGGINMDPATQAWCAQFVNATLGQAGMKGTGSAAARSFLNYGDPVLTPKQGDIAVFARRPDDPDPGAAYKGHAGFYDSTDEFGRVNLLGGNQGDAANIIPVEPDRLLGYRRPPGTPEEKLPDTLASAVSPELGKAIAGTDPSRREYNPNISPMGPINSLTSPFVGGTETPTLTTALRTNENAGRKERRMAEIRQELQALGNCLDAQIESNRTFLNGG